jgi:capsular polysaccharide transport system permease protein
MGLPPKGLGLHGFSTGEAPEGLGLRLRGFFGRRPYLWSVLVPTLLAAICFFAVAAPQYVSESRYLVRGRAQASASCPSR